VRGGIGSHRDVHPLWSSDTIEQNRHLRRPRYPMPYRVVAEQALARWRAAQAAMQSTDPQSAEWHAACLEEQRAKAAYQEAVEAARREHLLEPPPFPEASTGD
jgi:hypothetical protein